MVRNGDITVYDVKRILSRFWWVLAVSVVVCTAGAITAALLLPKRYESQTVILVEQPTVPSEYVKPIITENLDRRLASMQEQILSRTRLEPIIENFHLYPKDSHGTYSDEVLATFRNTVKITPMEPMQGTEHQLPGFYVSVDFENPQLAQQICSEITSMFLEQNAREREKQASRTTSFLSQQLDDAKTRLDEQDAKLAQFKKQYLGSLPDEEQTNLSLLTTTNSQLEANTQALSRVEQDLAFNQSLLNQQEYNLQAAQTGQNPETTEMELSKLREQLTVALAHYTPKHPDVIKLQEQIEKLKKRQVENLTAQSAVKPDNAAKGEEAADAQAATTPQTQQLRAKIQQDQLATAELTHRQTQIQQQIRELQGRVQASPVVEQQFKELTRNYQTALDFYNDLLKKRQNSEMATDLEHQQESEQFRVLDPPSLPDKPAFPNKRLFAGGGFGGGLALGLGIIYLIAYSDKSLHTERDVEKCLRLPVLTQIPTLKLAAQRMSPDLEGVLAKEALKQSV